MSSLTMSGDREAESVKWTQAEVAKAMGTTQLSSPASRADE
jgi:hypothetical protein